MMKIFLRDSHLSSSRVTIVRIIFFLSILVLGSWLDTVWRKSSLGLSRNDGRPAILFEQSYGSLAFSWFSPLRSNQAESSPNWRFFGVRGSTLRPRFRFSSEFGFAKRVGESVVFVIPHWAAILILVCAGTVAGKAPKEHPSKGT